jgi:hypothetical protein
LTTGIASRTDSILISTCREIGISASGSSTTTTPTGPRLFQERLRLVERVRLQVLRPRCRT